MLKLMGKKILTILRRSKPVAKSSSSAITVEDEQHFLIHCPMLKMTVIEIFFSKP